MIKTYFYTASRFFARSKGYTALNGVGLAIGLAGAFFIVLWAQDELRQDRFHEDLDQLYVALRNTTFADGTVETSPAVTRLASQALEAEVPEIEHAEMVSFESEVVLSRDAQSFRQRGYWADPAFFEMLSFPLLAGDPATALSAPDGVVISAHAADVFFGAGWQPDAIVGQVLQVDGTDARITGIAQDPPSTSTLQFDWVLPSESFYAANPWVDAWTNNGMQLFVQLTPGAELSVVNDKIRGLISENLESGDMDLFLQPFGDQYLYSAFENGQQSGGRIEYVRIFGLVALFLVLIACINFMNLATAQAAQRAREIGVRKSLGASRGSLAGQFLSEAVLIALGALGLAAVLVVALLPAFREISGKAITFSSLGIGTWVLFLGIAAVAGLVAGSYPALVLSGFNPARVLRGTRGMNAGNPLLRKGLVVFQFSASVFLMIGTFVVYQQLSFIQTKSLGLDRDNVISLQLEGTARDQYDSFKRTLLDQPGIESVSVTRESPIALGNATDYVRWDAKDEELRVNFYVLQAHYDLPETMRMTLKSGRTLSPDFADSTRFVINEAAARVMGMDDPVGESFMVWGIEGEIVGLVDDFHMASMYRPIEPVVMVLDEPLLDSGLLLVRTEPGQTAEALSGLERTVAQFSPGAPFDYEFVDAAFGQMYRSEQRIGRLANVFAAIAALIACLGLLGLAAQASARRRQEIGVRKVLGASVASVVGLLTKDFILLVAIAFAVAVPVAYLAMREWLSGFEYSIGLGVLPFALAGGLLLVLALATVSSQALRAATVDPIRALRSE